MSINEQEIKELVYKFGERVFKDFNEENVVTLTAERADNYLSRLSGYSALLEEEMGELELHKAREYPKYRDEHKSNVDATMAYDATEEGLRMIKLKRTLKAVDKIISACKNRLKRLENESFNRY